MNARPYIRAVIAVAAVALLSSGCDFLKNGGGDTSLPFEFSKLTLLTQGSGSITAQPAALSDGTYPKGTNVQLKAASSLRNGLWKFIMAIMFANTGAVDGLSVSLFSNWTGDLSGAANPATIQVNKDSTVSAVFARQGVQSVTAPLGGSSFNGPPVYFGISYYPDGRAMQADLYSNTSHTPAALYASATYTYNSAGQCTVVYTRDPSLNPLYTTYYTYTASGLIATISVTGTNSMGIAYSYDALGRVDTVTMTMSSWTQLMQCSYDDNGFLRQLDVTQNGTYYTYLCTNDANGNVTEMDEYNQSGVAQPSSNVYATYDTNGLMSTLVMNGITCSLAWTPL